MPAMKRSLKEVITIIVLLLMAAFLGGLVTSCKQDNNNENQAVNTTTLATESPALKKTEKTDITVQKPVKVYAGDTKTKQKLNLPEKVVANKNQQVIAGIKLSPRDDYPRSITTVLDASTGESETYITKEPLPWIAIDTRGSIGAYIGIKNGVQTARVQAKQNLIQIKRVHLGIVGSIDQPLTSTNNQRQQDYFIGVGAEFTW